MRTPKRMPRVKLEVVVYHGVVVLPLPWIQPPVDSTVVLPQVTPSSVVSNTTSTSAFKVVFSVVMVRAHAGEQRRDLGEAVVGEDEDVADALAGGAAPAPDGGAPGGGDGSDGRGACHDWLHRLRSRLYYRVCVAP